MQTRRALLDVDRILQAKESIAFAATVFLGITQGVNLDLELVFGARMEGRLRLAHIPSALLIGVGILGRLARPSFRTDFIAFLMLDSSRSISGFLVRSLVIVPRGCIAIYFSLMAFFMAFLTLESSGFCLRLFAVA